MLGRYLAVKPRSEWRIRVYRGYFKSLPSAKGLTLSDDMYIENLGLNPNNLSHKPIPSAKGL